MPVRFVFGRAASGKTRLCLNEIMEMARVQPLGAPIFFIVPRQSTFAAQRTLACGGELPGFCRIRVLSFDLLAESILAECGGEAIPTITPRGRRIILAHLLRNLADQLSVYRGAATRAGLAQELDTTFAELEHNGFGIGNLNFAIDELSAQSPEPQSARAILLDKLRDIRLLFEAYHAYLGADRIDPQRRRSWVLQCINAADVVKGAAIYIDGFLEFSDFEQQLILALAGVADVTITQLIDPDAAVVTNPHVIPDEMSLFHRTERAYRKLYFALNEENATMQPPLLLREACGRRDETLRFLEGDALVTSGAQQRATNAAVQFLQLSDARGEVDAAAITIRKWMRQGVRARDIAVLSRDASSYQELIQASFAEHEIPFFADRRRPAVHHPLLHAVTAVLTASRKHFPHAAMMTLIKCGLFPISREDSDLLENYVLEHNLQGSAWIDEPPWRFEDVEFEDDDSETPENAPRAHRGFDYDVLRRDVVAPLKPLTRAFKVDRAKVREFATALMSSLQLAGAAAKIAQWIQTAEENSEFELAAEHQQVWAQWVELLDEIVDLVGDECYTPTQFCELIETALAEFDLAIAPATLDQVIVGEFERTRYTHFRRVVLLGWHDGSFPRVSPEASVLGDRERDQLRAHRMHLETNTSRRLLDEGLLAYLAITRADEQVCITRSLTGGDGREIAASCFWRQVAAHFDDSPSERSPDTIPKYSTPRKVVDAVSRWARRIELDDPQIANDAAAIYQAVASSPIMLPRLSAALQQSLLALDYENKPKLSPAATAGVLRSPLRASVSRIESFARCPYQHFARHTLKLRKRIEPDISNLDLGTLYHSVLEKLVEAQIKAKRRWDPSQRPREADVAAVADEVSGALRNRIMLSSSRNQFLVRQMKRSIEEVMHRQHAAGAVGVLSPLRTELTFGLSDDDLPALQLRTPKGRDVLLRGKIDRVDIDLDSGAAAVFDYKLGKRELDLREVFHGLALQLLTYLLVLEADGQLLAKKQLTPIAGFYVRILRGIEKLDHPDKAVNPDDEEFALKVVQRGVFNVDFAGLLDPSSVSAGAKSKVVAFSRTKEGEPTQSANDSTTAEEFAALVMYVRRKLAELTDQILDGEINIRPRRLGTFTPCSNCDFRSLCRFEFSTGDRYDDVEAMKRKDVLEKLGQDNE